MNMRIAVYFGLLVGTLFYVRCAVGDIPRRGHMVVSTNGDGRADITFCIPEQRAGACTWRLFLDSVNEAGGRDVGQVGRHGTVSTVADVNVGLGRHTAYVVVYDGEGSPLDVIWATVSDHKSTTRVLMENYGGTLVGGIVGLMGTLAGAVFAYVLKERTTKRRTINKVLRRMKVLGSELLERWEAADRSLAVPVNLDIGAVEVLLTLMDEPERACAALRSLLTIHQMWRDDAAGDAQKARLVEVMKEIDTWLRQHKWTVGRL